MKKWIIYTIIIILIFFLSFYIGRKINLPEKHDTQEETLGSSENKVKSEKIRHSLLF